MSGQDLFSGAFAARARRAGSRAVWGLLWLSMVLVAFRVAAAPSVHVAEIDGAISPASASYFLRTLDDAKAQGAALFVLKLNTPGGLDTSMREMIRATLASPVPVAVYVAPSGARAASAGTYLLYAAHIAAMAPATNLGAATPVAIGIGGEGGKPEGKEGKPSAMEKKATQDAAAYIRSLAQLRGRNAQFAERAVLDAKSLSAEEALREKVIDVIAADVGDLLKRIDGRKVKTQAGMRTLALAEAATVAVAPNWKERLLAGLADPNIALLLLMVGVYGLLFEFYSPGMALPGVAGGICLLLAAYGLALLPLNFTGVALVVLGVGLMIAEAFAPSFGVLGLGGVLAFVGGALMLVDADVPGMQVSLGLVVPLAATSALLLGIAGAYALRARKRKPVSGREAMVGAPAEALEDIEREGWVRAMGEMWRARTPVPLKRGARVRIRAVEGLTLEVEPREDSKGEGP